LHVSKHWGNSSRYYTSFLMGKVHAKGADGKVTVLAEGLPGINSLAFNQEGRLFATQVFLGVEFPALISVTGKRRSLPQG